MPSATSTLDTLGASIINTTVSFVTIVITNYWPFILVFIVLAGLIGLAYRYVHLGTGKGK
jgi:hypothetical protein